MKKVKTISTENCHFYSCEKSLYIAWACFRNGLCCLMGAKRVKEFCIPLKNKLDINITFIRLY